MYSWPRVAERTEAVYVAAADSRRDDGLAARFRRYAKCGVYFGKLCCLLVAFDYLLWCLLEWLFPAADIDVAVDIPPGAFHESMPKHVPDEGLE
jgi:phosphatidylinositol N-acetylglucosaminyltransferase subunit A